MNRLKVYFGTNFYSEAVMFLILIIALIISLKTKTPEKKLKYFPFYFAFFILTLIVRYLYVGYFIGSRYEEIAFEIDRYFMFSLIIIELLVFLNFFYRLINGTWRKYTLKVLGIGFVLFSVHELLFEEVDLATLAFNRMFALEAFCCLVPCFFYYQKIFKDPPTLNLSREPSFWIVTGLFFFWIWNLPYSLVLENLFSKYREVYNYLFSVIYIMYCILFVMIIKAFLCKPELVKS